jgi:hypothetical protein
MKIPNSAQTNIDLTAIGVSPGLAAQRIDCTSEPLPAVRASAQPPLQHLDRKLALF